IDVTKKFHNLLQKEESKEKQTYLWDSNIVGVIDDSEDSIDFCLQDELGSSIRLSDETGQLTETYGYDEFGQDKYQNQGLVYPFGYTGYQIDNISETNFAQAREFQPEVGRFVSEDILKGTIMMPCTLNSYGYCWNNPIPMISGEISARL
ncbi:MAG: RHS repeat-associated core domain-containing protein, partial [Lachnospiraceae bacterium]